MINVLKRFVRSAAARAGYEIRRVQPASAVVAPESAPPLEVSTAPEPPPPPAAVPEAQDRTPPTAVVQEGAAPATEALSTPPPAPQSSPIDVPNFNLYVELFGPDVLDRKPFLNVGAGDFSHPCWRNVDFYTEAYAADVRNNIHIHHDLSEIVPLPVESDSIEAVFTSHTIEHIQNAHDEHLFREVHRILKPGGIFRITCPDIDLYYRAYRRGDRHFFPDYGEFYKDQPIDQLFLREFATQISTANNDELPIEKVSTEELRELFERLPMEEALDVLCSRVDYKRWYRQVPGNHVNWWNFDKASKFLRAAGFKEVYRSGHGQSACPVMRIVPLFDWTARLISLYVEAVKL